MIMSSEFSEICDIVNNNVCTCTIILFMYVYALSVAIQLSVYYRDMLVITLTSHFNLMGYTKIINFVKKITIYSYPLKW